MTPDLEAELTIFASHDKVPQVKGVRWEAILCTVGGNFFALIEPSSPPVDRDKPFLAQIYLLDPSNALVHFKPETSFTINAAGEVGEGKILSVVSRNSV
jgi:hypothetical protein